MANGNRRTSRALRLLQRASSSTRPAGSNGKSSGGALLEPQVRMPTSHGSLKSEIQATPPRPHHRPRLPRCVKWRDSNFLSNNLRSVSLAAGWKLRRATPGMNTPITVMLEILAEIPSQIASEIVTEIASKIVPEIAPEIARRRARNGARNRSEKLSERLPEKLPEIVPELLPEIVPELLPEIA